MASFSLTLVERISNKAPEVFTELQWCDEVATRKTQLGYETWRGRQIESYISYSREALSDLLELSVGAFTAPDDTEAVDRETRFHQAILNFWRTARLDDTESETVVRASAALGLPDPVWQTANREISLPEDFTADLERLCLLGQDAYESWSGQSCLERHLCRMLARYEIEVGSTLSYHLENVLPEP